MGDAEVGRGSPDTPSEQRPTTPATATPAAGHASASAGRPSSGTPVAPSPPVAPGTPVAPGPPVAPGTALLSRPFSLSDVSDLRRAVSRCAAAAGLAGQLLDDFVLAINELVTNAVRHGGGNGLLRLWRAEGELVCEVSDRGAGIGARATRGHRRPPPDTVGGWGLWLARQLSGTMAVATSAAGTAVRISTAVPVPRANTTPPD